MCHDVYILLFGYFPKYLLSKRYYRSLWCGDWINFSRTLSPKLISSWMHHQSFTFSIASCSHSRLLAVSFWRSPWGNCQALTTDTDFVLLTLHRLSRRLLIYLPRRFWQRKNDGFAMLQRSTSWLLWTNPVVIAFLMKLSKNSNKISILFLRIFEVFLLREHYFIYIKTYPIHCVLLDFFLISITSICTILQII